MDLDTDQLQITGSRDTSALIDWTPSLKHLHSLLQLVVKPHLFNSDLLDTDTKPSLEQLADFVEQGRLPPSTFSLLSGSGAARQELEAATADATPASKLAQLPATLALEFKVRWLFLR